MGVPLLVVLRCNPPDAVTHTSFIIPSPTAALVLTNGFAKHGGVLRWALVFIYVCIFGLLAA
jgi:hypothetical protein